MLKTSNFSLVVIRTSSLSSRALLGERPTPLTAAHEIHVRRLHAGSNPYLSQSGINVLHQRFELIDVVKGPVLSTQCFLKVEPRIVSCGYRDDLGHLIHLGLSMSEFVSSCEELGNRFPRLLSVVHGYARRLADLLELIPDAKTLVRLLACKPAVREYYRAYRLTEPFNCKCRQHHRAGRDVRTSSRILARDGIERFRSVVKLWPREIPGPSFEMKFDRIAFWHITPLVPACQLFSSNNLRRPLRIHKLAPAYRYAHECGYRPVTGSVRRIVRLSALGVNTVGA